MKKLLFVYNPRAGKEMLKPRLSDVLDIFVKAGYEHRHIVKLIIKSRNTKLANMI